MDLPPAILHFEFPESEDHRPSDRHTTGARRFDNRGMIHLLEDVAAPQDLQDQGTALALTYRTDDHSKGCCLLRSGARTIQPLSPRLS